ncbi:hypothetical protein E1180_07390 [Roseibium denhamense]|nr:hypothetical protein [Roseibium denhamense]
MTGPVIAPAAADGEVLENHVLGIGVCPPWNPQTGEVCEHSTVTVADAISERLQVGDGNTQILINEQASAAGLKLALTELAQSLDGTSRLIVYANVPSEAVLKQPDGTALRQVLQLWAEEQPASTDEAIEQGLFVSAPAFAAMLHTVPAGEVIVLLDTSNSDPVDPELLDSHVVDADERPEALITSAGPGQKANYAADRTISLFAKHLALALTEAEGTLLDALHVAASGTRQAAIPICASLKETQPVEGGNDMDCAQVPQVHDPSGVLNALVLPPPATTDAQ